MSLLKYECEACGHQEETDIGISIHERECKKRHKKLSGLVKKLNEVLEEMKKAKIQLIVNSQVVDTQDKDFVLEYAEDEQAISLKVDEDKRIFKNIEAMEVLI